MSWPRPKVVHTCGPDEPPVCRAIPVAKLDEVLHAEPDQLSGFMDARKLPNINLLTRRIPLRRVLCQWQFGEVDRIRVECMNRTFAPVSSDYDV